MNRKAGIIVCSTIIKEEMDWGIKKIVDRRLITKILAYSAMKIKAKGPLLNSVLNPETSSDSPSAKSNGVRLVSARVVINHVTANGIIIINGQVNCRNNIKFRFMVNKIIRAPKRIRAILTS